MLVPMHKWYYIGKTRLFYVSLKSPVSQESHGKVFGPESTKEMRHKSSKIVTAIPDAKESLMASHTDQTLRGFSSITKKTGKLTQKYMA